MVKEIKGLQNEIDIAFGKAIEGYKKFFGTSSQVAISAAIKLASKYREEIISKTNDFVSSVINYCDNINSQSNVNFEEVENSFKKLTDYSNNLLDRAEINLQDSAKFMGTDFNAEINGKRILVNMFEDFSGIISNILKDQIEKTDFDVNELNIAKLKLLNNALKSIIQSEGIKSEWNKNKELLTIMSNIATPIDNEAQKIEKELERNLEQQRKLKEQEELIKQEEERIQKLKENEEETLKEMKKLSKEMQELHEKNLMYNENSEKHGNILAKLEEKQKKLLFNINSLEEEKNKANWKRKKEIDKELKDKNIELQKLEVLYKNGATGLSEVTKNNSETMNKLKEKAKQYSELANASLDNINSNLEQLNQEQKINITHNNETAEAIERIANHNKEGVNDLIATLTILKERVAEHDLKFQNLSNLSDKIKKTNEIKQRLNEIKRNTNFTEDDSLKEKINKLEKINEELVQRINFDPEQIVRNRENIEQDRKNIKELESKILKNSYAIQVNKDLEKEKIRISEELSNTPWYKFLKKRKLKKELDNVEKSYNDSSKLLREIRNSLFEKVSKINVKEQENITKEKENGIKRNLDENSIIQKQSTILTK